MKAVTILAAAATAAASAISNIAARDTTPITIKGNAFFQGDKRFYIRGVDWQPGGAANPVDPLADGQLDACKRDVSNFQQLGLNTVRVYTVDNSLKHDQCMQLLQQAGIYLILDVNWAKYSLNRADNKSCATSYNSAYLQNVFATIDAFASYPNTMAFFSGNEIINDQPTSITAPYIKAVTRDMKQYISARKYRTIPVGYSAADVAEVRNETALYLNCGDDSVARSDFFAFNDYTYCKNSFDVSWAPKVEAFKSYSLPMFLSEYGCNKNPPRDFKEVADLYSSQMTGVFSGGLVYEYFQEDSQYGLVSADGTQYLDDFKTLQNMNSQVPLPSGDGGYRAQSGNPSTCPPGDSNWLGFGNGLPLIPEAAKKYFTNGAGTGVGLKGTGSQDGAGANVQGAQSTAWSNSPSQPISSNSGSGGSSSGGSSTSSGGSASKSSGAAMPGAVPQLSLMPLAIGAVVLVSSLAGGSFFVM